jgi:hypothetical protein
MIKRGKQESEIGNAIAARYRVGFFAGFVTALKKRSQTKRPV